MAHLEAEGVRLRTILEQDAAVDDYSRHSSSLTEYIFVPLHTRLGLPRLPPWALTFGCNLSLGNFTEITVITTNISLRVMS